MANKIEELVSELELEAKRTNLKEGKLSFDIHIIPNSNSNKVLVLVRYDENLRNGSKRTKTSVARIKNITAKLEVDTDITIRSLVATNAQYIRIMKEYPGFKCIVNISNIEGEICISDNIEFIT